MLVQEYLKKWRIFKRVKPKSMVSLELFVNVFEWLDVHHFPELFHIFWHMNWQIMYSAVPL